MKRLIFFPMILLCFFCGKYTQAQTAKLTLDLTYPSVTVSPKLYGLMTEESHMANIGSRASRYCLVRFSLMSLINSTEQDP